MPAKSQAQVESDICPNCGNVCSISEVYCPKCGKNLDELFESDNYGSRPLGMQKLLVRVFTKRNADQLVFFALGGAISQGLSWTLSEVFIGSAHIAGVVGGALGGMIIAVAIARTVTDTKFRSTPYVEMAIVFAGAFGLSNIALFVTLSVGWTGGLLLAIVFLFAGLIAGIISAVGTGLVVFREVLESRRRGFRTGIGWSLGFAVGFLAAYLILLMLGSMQWPLSPSLLLGPVALYAFAGSVGGFLGGALAGVVTIHEVHS